jgi:hypothetical protein
MKNFVIWMTDYRTPQIYMLLFMLCVMSIVGAWANLVLYLYFAGTWLFLVALFGPSFLALYFLWQGYKNK